MTDLNWVWALVGAVLVGSLTSILPTSIADRRREKRENRYRWSSHFYELSSDFSGVVRQFMHEAGDRLEVRDKARLEQLVVLQGQIRVQTSRLALLAGEPVLSAAQTVRRHCFSVIQACETGSGGRAAEYPQGPYVALDLALDKFYQDVRDQIGLQKLRQVRQLD